MPGEGVLRQQGGIQAALRGAAGVQAFHHRAELRGHQTGRLVLVIRPVRQHGPRVNRRGAAQNLGLEPQRIGSRSGVHRSRQSMSFAVMRKTTTRANWASRCSVLRSVFLRICP